MSSNLSFMDNTSGLEERVEDLLGRLTLEEKFSLCGGKDLWKMNPVKRLNIKSFRMTDGPNGVGALGSYFRKTTAFPSSICLSAGWNPDLAHQFGVAAARETRDINRHMILAPGINIQRTPLCGRTFEYLTEDPYLNKKIAVGIVKGIQSLRIAACVKHFAANNQETRRFVVSSEVSERALQEIYLPAFKAAVEDGDAWSFMACYNKLNGVHGCENKNLLVERLMEEWGFRGFVVSDWFAARATASTGACVNAGLSLEMPGRFKHKYKLKQLRDAFNKGKFTEETLNRNIKRLLRIMFLTGLFDKKNTLPEGSRNTKEHHAVARKIAEEGIVLLKNENDLLPLKMDELKKIAVVGWNADKKHSFGGGSSMIRAFYEITPLKGLKNKCRGKIKIVSSPAKADVAIVVTGLRHSKGMDSENRDRYGLELPEKEIELIKNTVSINPQTVVVLVNGSPLAMDDWLDRVPSVVEAWYPGMEGGNAIADILFGDVNPSGRLPVTFPKKLSDSPAHASLRTFPGRRKVYYDEGIFVGYRHFDTREIEPLFPFGFGLSYTSFKYDNLRFSRNKLSGNEKVIVSIDITNTGRYAGAEVAQLYIQDVECSVERPIKELKGFKKIGLKQGEKGTVAFEFNNEDLSFYDEQKGSWIAEAGKFNILVGSSSRDIRLKGEIEYQG